MAQMQMRYCRVVTAWLEAEDYPTLLGCCDLGMLVLLWPGFRHCLRSKCPLFKAVLDVCGVMCVRACCFGWWRLASSLHGRHGRGVTALQ